MDLVVVILRDDAYGIIRWKQAGMGFQNFRLEDFVKYAEAYRAQGHRVQSSNHLTSLLNECINGSGVHLIEVPVDYSENEKILIEELKSKTCIL